jgi:undecaprenyl-diphosphatase
MPGFIQLADETILRALRSSFACSFSDWLMPIMSDKRCLIPIVLILIPYLVIKHGNRGRRAVLVMILAASLTDVVSSRILKPAFHRLRPYQEEAVLAGQQPSGSFSFPSSHAANFGAAVTGLAFYLPRTIPLLAVLWLGVSLSRIYLNAHYPSDCLAGLFLGIALALASYYVVEYYSRRYRLIQDPSGAKRKQPKE